MTKKFMRIALVAFVLCVVLALTSMAYKTDVFGRVTGLEDNVDYTYAQYDFATDAYGEFAELTADTALTAGVWGIKAGDAEPEALFVAGTDSGYVNWYDNETGVYNSASFGGKVDGYVPGKWTVNTDGIYRNIGSYQNTEIILWVLKSKFQEQVQVAKTVTVDEVKYPVYAVGETEYYLKDEAYYAVADNTLYEGEETPVAVTVGTWVNAVPIIDAEGENNNKLQESVISYGFANNQVIPANKAIELGFDGITSQAGAMLFNTKADGTKYAKADIKGTFTWVVKNIGSADETRYTVDIDATQKVFTAPAEMAESNGYLVAIEFAPYANCPDDIFVGHASDGSSECYAYINPAEGRNAVEYTAELPEAPAVQDGYGTIYVEPTDYYVEIAPVTLGADGTVFTYGEWTDYEYDIAATRDMAGLYAVRGYNGSLTTETTYAYAYGAKEDRAALGKLHEYSDATRVAVTSGTDDFVTGTWTGKWINAASIATHSTFGKWYLGTLGGQVSSTQTTNLKNALATLAELKAAETLDEDAIAAQEKTVLGYQTTIANNFSDVSYKYSFESDEIIKASEAGTFAISYFQNNGSVIMDYVRTKVIAYVADRDGNVTPYTKTFADIAYTYGKTITQTINFADFLPEEGWLVGLEIYPSADIAPEEVSEVRGTGNIRWLLRVDPAHYTVGDAAELPTLDSAPSELYAEKGVVKGFKDDAVYAYAIFDLNGYESSDWTAVPAGTTELDLDTLGMVAVKYNSDGYSHNGSLEKNLFLGGTSNNIYHVTTKDTTTQKTVTVDSTKYNVYTIDGVEYYLVSTTTTNEETGESTTTDTYYAVSDNSEYTGENAASAAKVFTTKDVPDTVYLSNTTDNLTNVKFNEGKWSGIAASNELALKHGYLAGCIGCTDTPIASTLATAIQTAVNSGDATAIAEARAKAAATSDGIYYSYAFLPEEVVKMADFESFKVRASRRQSGFSVVGTVQTKVVLKVVDADGNLIEKTAAKNANYDWTGTTHTFTRDDFGVAEGYIVGIVVYPYVLTEGSYLDYASKTNGDYDIYIYSDGYKVTRTLDAAAQPTGIVFEGNKISGLDADETYVYGLYTIAGRQGEWTTVTGVTEITHDLTGLIGISLAGDGIFTSDSKPVIGYLAGSVAARSELGNVVDGKPLYDTSKVDTWKTGIWTGDYLSWVDQTTGAYSFLDQSTGVNCSMVETLWLYQTTEEEAEARLTADAAKTPPTHWATYNVTSKPSRLQAVIDAHYAVENYEANLEANKLALQTQVAESFATRNIKYALDETEILPVDELLTMSFVSKKRQGGFIFSDVKSKAVIHVMDSNANVTAYEWWSDSWAVAGSGTWKKITVDVQSIENLPEEGWIVGIEFYPWADVEPATIVAVDEGRVDASSIAYSFGQQHVCIGYYPADYTVYVAPLAKPNAVYADGKFTGLDSAKTYAYGRFTADGIETTEVTGVTEVAVDSVGVWGIKEVSTTTEYLDSAYVVGYNKDMTEARENILHLQEATTKAGATIMVPVVATAGGWDYTNYFEKEVVFNEATWTGYSLTNSLAINYNFNPLILGTTSCTIGYATTIKPIDDATTDEDLVKARAELARALGSIYYSYEYTAAEALPMNEFVSWQFKVAERQGSAVVLEGSLQTKFVFKVVNEDGVIEDRVVYKDATLSGAGSTIDISIDDFAETDGYIVGIVIYPYGNCPEGTVLGSDADPTSEDIVVHLVENKYLVYPAAPTAAEKPVLEVTAANAVISVTNYNPLFDYAYSADNGETWTEFTGSKFNATKASTQYVVKALANDFFEESEISEAATSPAMTLVGTSLVLDGQIGLKVYLDIDMDLVNTVQYNTTKVNSDYANDPDLKATEYRKSSYVSFDRSLPYMTNIRLDEESGLYYLIIYLPAKDLDNTSFEVDMGVFLKSDTNTRVHLGNVGHNFAKYINQAKTLAAEGNAEFVAALDLIENLENYANYADNYFNNGTDATYVSTASTDDIAAATRTNGTLEGVQFYGTSLLLEDQVTIRHYFTVEDIDAFNAAYDVEGKYGVKGNFIYFDIADIPAQELGDVKTLSITNMEGEVVYEVTYSVTNYIASMMNDDDVNLVSLVNAMYDYYLAAADYAK